jgi:hypothetical protein
LRVSVNPITNLLSFSPDPSLGETRASSRV